MISLVIPIFNEEETLRHLYERLKSASEQWDDEYEVLFVDDGSNDKSFSLMTNIADRDKNFKVIKLSRNYGHQAAISAGISLAQGDAVIVMDGDLQDPPEEITNFLEKWKEGFDVVYAIRKYRKEGLLRRIAYATFYRALKNVASDLEIPLDAGDFCLMDRKVVDILNKNMPEQKRFLRGLRAFAGFKQVGVGYDRPERSAGKSKYTFSKLLGLALDGIFDFSTFPLQIASYLGAFISLTSFLVGMFFIIHRIIGFKIFGHSPSDTPGLATLAAGVFFLGGLILLMLGVVGEYIGRIYLEVKRRPFYIVESVYFKDQRERSRSN